jgi:TPR repeat protein
MPKNQRQSTSETLSGDFEDKEQLQQHQKQQRNNDGEASPAPEHDPDILLQLVQQHSDADAALFLAQLPVAGVRNLAASLDAHPSTIPGLDEGASEILSSLSSTLFTRVNNSTSQRAAAMHPEALVKAPDSGSSKSQRRRSNPRGGGTDIRRRAAESAPKKTSSSLAQLGVMHQQQHQKLLAHMSHIASRPVHALPATATACPALLLRAQTQCIAAAAQLQQAVTLGHLHSRADLAWMLIDGREGVARNQAKAFELVNEGARLGCCHCAGVIACCYWGGFGCVADKPLSLQLARVSALGGSRYGMWTLGVLHRLGDGGAGRDPYQAMQLFGTAATLNLDAAQFMLGYAHFYGIGVADDITQALQWFHAAAAQGHPDACYMVGRCMERLSDDASGRAAAVHWYQRAKAAGHAEAVVELYGASGGSGRA